MQHTKDEWKDVATKFATLWALALLRKDADFGVADIVVFDSLTANSKKVTEMLRDEEKSDEDPTEEKLHEMMEQAAKEICDERD